MESLFAAVRLRTAAAKRFKRVDNATAAIWKTLPDAEKTFRRLDAPGYSPTSPAPSCTSLEYVQ